MTPARSAAAPLKPDTPPVSAQKPFSITSIAIRRDRAVCTVSIPDARFRQTNERLAKAVLADYPTLPQHACINGTGDTFAAVMEATSVPHLFEHLVIDIQIRDTLDPEATFVGTTEWVEKAAGIAEIQVSFVDDLQVLRAFAEAADYLNDAVITYLP